MNATTELANRPKTESREITWRGMLVEVQGKFTQAEAAPQCGNPDRASFSDDGVKADADVSAAFFLKPGSINPNDRIPLSDVMLEQLQEDEDLCDLLGLRG